MLRFLTLITGMFLFFATITATPGFCADGVEPPQPLTKPDAQAEQSDRSILKFLFGSKGDDTAAAAPGNADEMLADETFTPSWDAPEPGQKPADRPPPKKINLSIGPLNAREAGLYKQIFAFQETGNLADADRVIARLNNGLLMGHVLAQRYLHPTATRASFAQLKNWLDQYADHPQAGDIYNLAERRKPEGYNGALNAPGKSYLISGNLGAVSRRGKVYRPAIKRSDSENAAVNNLFRNIKKSIRDGQPSKAREILQTASSGARLDDVELKRVRALIGAGYLYQGNRVEALRFTRDSIGAKVPLAGWVAGMVYWQDGIYARAAEAFEATSLSPYASGWMVSAAAYWASRAHMRVGNVAQVSRWLEIAASFPRTFYGLVATRALGQDPDFNWTMPEAGQDAIKKIIYSKPGMRAKGLIDSGQAHLAELELQALFFQKKTIPPTALLAFAHQNKLSHLTYRLGHVMAKDNETLYDSALYPLVAYRPEGGYALDRALIHAFIRQESQFDAAAQSGSGATGLMQLMPATARYIAGDGAFEKAGGLHALKNPYYNLMLGQRYLQHLLDHPVVEGDVLYLAIAYNAGPGKLSKWKAERTTITDPLLFIELLPYAETRAFVERVLSNYWIYRIQRGQPTPSLDALAEGRSGLYESFDDDLKMAGK